MGEASVAKRPIYKRIGFFFLFWVDIALFLWALVIMLFEFTAGFSEDWAVIGFFIGIAIASFVLFIFLKRFLFRRIGLFSKRLFKIFLVLTSFFLFGLFYLFQPVEIVGASVGDGRYKEGQIALGERITYLFREPKIGDVVTFASLSGNRIGQIYDIQEKDATVIYLVKHDTDKDSKLTKDKIISRVYWGLSFSGEAKIVKETALEEKNNAVQYEAPKYDPKGKAFFYRFNGSQINDRVGIWTYDFSQKTETQLISFQEMLGISNISPNDLYANPEISPDLTKIVFYLKSNGDSYNLWLYDLIAGKKQKLLEDVALFNGYIQSPSWSKDSDLIYLTFYENGLNRLFLIDLYGNKKRLANSYVGQIFWPKIINDALLIFYPSLPEVNEIGILNLKTDKVDVTETPTSSYFSKIDIFQENFLIKSPSIPLLSSSGSIDNVDIYSLEKLDLKNLKANKFPIPKEIIFTPETKRIQPKVVCGEWALLENILKGGDIGEKTGIDLYRYNLVTNFVEPFSIDGELKYAQLNCGLNNDNSFYTLMKDNRFVFFDLSNPSNNKEYDLNEINSNLFKDSCLYQERFYPDTYSSEHTIYIDLVSSQSCKSFDERAGLYKIFLDQKNMIKISNPKDYSEQDFPIQNKN